MSSIGADSRPAAVRMYTAETEKDRVGGVGGADAGCASPVSSPAAEMMRVWLSLEYDVEPVHAASARRTRRCRAGKAVYYYF
jgi:hypothetical protein